MRRDRRGVMRQAHDRSLGGGARVHDLRPEAGAGAGGDSPEPITNGRRWPAPRGGSGRGGHHTKE